MASIDTTPWHLAKPGRILDVHCGAEGSIAIVGARWLADCEACLTASDPCPRRDAEPSAEVG